MTDCDRDRDYESNIDSQWAEYEKYCQNICRNINDHDHTACGLLHRIDSPSDLPVEIHALYRAARQAVNELPFEWWAEILPIHAQTIEAAFRFNAIALEFGIARDLDEMYFARHIIGKHDLTYWHTAFGSARVGTVIDMSLHGTQLTGTRTVRAHGIFTMCLI